MAGSRIKGITIELDGDTTKLTAALKQVDSQVRSTQSKLKDVNQLLKADPGNKDLLSQKYKYLGTEVDATKEKLKTLKEAEKQALDSGNVNTEQYDALQREIEETEQKLKSLTKEYQNFGSVSSQQIAAAGEKVSAVGEKIGSAGTKMSAAVTAPVVAGAAAAVNAYGDVDKEFNLVKQTMGDTANTAEDFDGLWKQIGDSAKASVYGMSDATEATLNFARQGFTAKQATDMLTPAMSLAAGTGTDLSEVTSGLGNSMKMFGADSQEAADYADVLAKAQAQANTTTSELFDAISVAGPICKTVGWNVKDLATLTDVFGNAGISGSEGANALKTGLARLAAPASTGAKSMDALGLSTGKTYAIFDANGSLKSMPEVIRNLNAAFQGLSQQEQLEAASNIFGKNQMSKWLTLIQSSPEEVESLRTALDGVAGSADNMSNALMSGTGGTIEQLKSTFDVLSVTVGQLVAPAFQKVMESAIGLMNAVMEMDPKTQKLILILAGIAAAAGPVLVVIGKMAAGIGAVMKLAPAIVSGVGLVKGAVTGLFALMAANPIMLVIAGIAALVSGFVLLWNKSEAFRNFWKGLWDGIKDVTGKAANGIQGFFGKIGDFFGSLHEKAGEVRTSISEKFSKMTEDLKERGEEIKGTLLTVGRGLGDSFGAGFEKAKEAASGFFSSIVASYQEGGGGLSGILNAYFTSVRSLISAELTGIQNLIGVDLSGVKATVQMVLSGIQNFLTGFLSGLQEKTAGLFQNIGPLISTGWTTITGAIQTGLLLIESIVEGAATLIMLPFKTLWENCKGEVSGAMTSIGEAVTTGLTAARERAGVLLDGIRSKFSSVMEGIGSVVSSGLSKIRSFFATCRLQLPKIKLPHFSIAGNLSINPPQVPHLSVSWYKKAYDNAVLFSSPTVLPTAGGLKGFGDGNGSELVVGKNSLMNMIAEASQQDATAQAIQSLGSQLLSLIAEYLPQLANQQIVLDGGTLVGKLAPQMNKQLGVIAGRKQRG